MAGAQSINQSLLLSNKLLQVGTSAYESLYQRADTRTALHQNVDFGRTVKTMFQASRKL